MFDGITRQLRVRDVAVANISAIHKYLLIRPLQYHPYHHFRITMNSNNLPTVYDLMSRRFAPIQKEIIEHVVDTYSTKDLMTLLMGDFDQGAQDQVMKKAWDWDGMLRTWFSDVQAFRQFQANTNSLVCHSALL
jgi:hypothetical protein